MALELQRSDITNLVAVRTIQNFDRFRSVCFPYPTPGPDRPPYPLGS